MFIAIIFLHLCTVSSCAIIQGDYQLNFVIQCRWYCHNPKADIQSRVNGLKTSEHSAENNNNCMLEHLHATVTKNVGLKEMKKSVPNAPVFSDLLT